VVAAVIFEAATDGKNQLRDTAEEKIKCLWQIVNNMMMPHLLVVSKHSLTLKQYNYESNCKIFQC
jgi:hypothetical protein